MVHAADTRKRRRQSNAVQPPVLNTWVTVAPEQRSNRAKTAAAAAALVSSVDLERGEATLLYPCELVLAHGFSGSPLKRMVMPFQRLRAGQDNERMRQLLMKAVRAAAAASFPSAAAENEAPAEEEAVPGADEDGWRPVQSSSTGAVAEGVAAAVQDAAAVGDAPPMTAEVVSGMESDNQPSTQANYPATLEANNRSAAQSAADAVSAMRIDDHLHGQVQEASPAGQAPQRASSLTAAIAVAEGAAAPLDAASGAVIHERQPVQVVFSESFGANGRAVRATSVPAQAAVGDVAAVEGSKACGQPGASSDDVRSRGEAAVQAPCTPCEAEGNSRVRSRSSDKKANKANAKRRLRAIVLAAGRAFDAKDQIALADLCSALEADNNVKELVPPAWSAKEAITELEAMNKVFVADELVFRL